ncbi:MAG: hypothetical protein QOF76_2529, partial [Solirubrobacteraceae bacterium]|nr:hypothetical protein [Solirubrobacteraceae bacterium]
MTFARRLLPGLVALALIASALPTAARAAAPCVAGTTTAISGGNWDDGTVWSNGVPSFECSTTIPAGIGIVSLGGASDGLTLDGSLELRGVTLDNNGPADASLSVRDATTISGSGSLHLSSGVDPTVQSPKSGNPGRAIFNGTIDNSGTVSIDTGEPGPNTGRELRGSITNNATGTLAFHTDSYDGFAGTWINRGSMSVDAGTTLTITGAGAGPTVTQAAGTFANGGTTRVFGTLNHTGGDITGHAVDLVGTLHAPGPGTAGFRFISVPGCCSGGDITGDIGAGDTVSIHNSGSDLGVRLDTDVTNRGTFTMDGGDKEDQLIGSPTLTNAGTMNLSQGVTGQIQTPFTNRGTLHVTAGTQVNFGRGAVTLAAGAVDIAAGAVFNTYSDGATLSGGTVSNGGAWLASDLTHSGGTATGNPIQSCGGSLKAQGPGTAGFVLGGFPGCAGGSFGSDVGAGDTVTLHADNAVTDIFAGSFTNHGTIDVASTADHTVQLHGTLLTNEGTLRFENGNIAMGLLNDGAVTIAAGTQTNFANRSPVRQESGRFDVDGVLNAGDAVGVSGGTLAVNGSVSVDPFSELQVTGGILRGGGTVTANSGVRNSGGTVHPDGTLTITGPYTQEFAGALAADVGATVSRLAVSGAATLAGALHVTTPTPRTGTFRVLSAGSVSGRFAPVTFAGQHFAVGYDATGVDLTGTAPADGPELSVGDARVAEGDSGTTDLVFGVNLSAATTHPVTVDWATADGTATAPDDYAPAAGTVTIAAGDTHAEIRVPVTGDTTAEPDESLTVSLTGPVGAGLGDGRATGTIAGDDVSLTAATPDHGGDTGRVTVTATGTGFGSSATLALRRGTDSISGEDVTVDATGTHLTATFDLYGAPHGVYDLVAGGGTATLAGGFTVQDANQGRVVVSGTAPYQLRAGFAGRFVVTLHNTRNVDTAIDFLRIAGQSVKLRPAGNGAYADDPLGLDGEVIGAGATRSLTFEFKSTTNVPHATLGLRAEVYEHGTLDGELERSVASADVAADFPPPPGRVTGHVRNPGGDPLGGVPVTLQRASGFDRVAFSGADGGFSFPELPVGSYTVALGGGGAYVGRQSVELTTAGPTADVTLSAQVTELSGTVRAAGGDRLGGATVILSRDGAPVDTVTADGTGGFRFALLEGGTYDLI